MSTQTNPLHTVTAQLADDEKRLSYEEGWELIFSLFNSAGDMYAKVGGADAFVRAERASWGEDNAA